MKSLTLHNVNSIPKQTWNNLQMNDMTLKVKPCESAACCTPQGRMKDMQMSAGPEATAYLDQISDCRRIISIDPDTKDGYLELSLNEDNLVATTDITVGKNSELTLVIDASSSDDNKELMGANLRLILEENAHVEVISISIIGRKTTYIENVGAVLDSNAHIQARQFFLGAGRLAGGVWVEAQGDDTDFAVKTRYLARPHNVMDMNYVATVHGKRAKGSMIASGVLQDYAKKCLKFTVDLQKGCKGSEGEEREVALIMGESAENKTLPTILCHEDEVAGNHGATIGSISLDQLEYLHDRGLTDAEISKLFAKSVIDDAKAHTKEDTKARELVESVLVSLGYND